MTDRIDSIQSYLDRLTQELKGSDPAIIMDAVNDASEYFHSEVDAIIAASPGSSSEAAFEKAAEKFGSPDEVARSFLEMEVQVDKAFGRALAKRERRSRNAFFGVIREPRAWASLLYMLISFLIAVVHVFWVGYGLPLSFVSCAFIIGIPICLFFIASLRALTLVEFRLIETLLGERMPRRPIFVKSDGNVLTKFTVMVKDGYTWKTILYLLLMIPTGAIYGAIVFVGIGAVFELLYLPLLPNYSDLVRFVYGSGSAGPGPWGFVVTIPLGIIVLACVLHLFLFMGRLHARLVKRLMVGRSAPAAPATT